MVVCLDHSIGSLLASDDKLNDDNLLACNGNSICKSEYPEYFKLFRIKNDVLMLPNLDDIRQQLNNQLYFYIRVK